MTDYLLFIDTEASGLPKNWRLSYSAKNNWPFSVQISWIIYTKEGQKVKEENYFIKENDLKIAGSALKIHGITQSFLTANGSDRGEVMQKLSDDVQKFQPLIVGHFMEFDYHMAGVDFYRTGIENPLKKEMTFCTMRATAHFVKNPALKFLRLGELYEMLFNAALTNQHNALADATATSECFFELIRRGNINEETIINQQKETFNSYSKSKGTGCIIPLFFILFLFFLILYQL